jgi:uncharacterized membrane protein YfcA
VGQVAAGFLAALLISIVTAPVGVSGAMFLIPVQLELLDVPNPAVTPTNLLYNVVAGPGALVRYRRAGQLAGPLTRQLLLGTLPGVVIGAVMRVYLVPGAQAFRLVVACVLVPLGAWLIARTFRRFGHADRPLKSGHVTAAALVVGVVGGIYGIGGGSILGPILVGTGLAVAQVAPAALASTFVTSVIGSAAFVVLSTLHDGAVAPDWSVGLALGAGGLVGGYVGARLQPFVPDRALRCLLGALALALGVMYGIQGTR